MQLYKYHTLTENYKAMDCILLLVCVLPWVAILYAITTHTDNSNKE